MSLIDDGGQQIETTTIPEFFAFAHCLDECIMQMAHYLLRLTRIRRFGPGSGRHDQHSPDQVKP
jgi:hypothetical protein